MVRFRTIRTDASVFRVGVVDVKIHRLAYSGAPYGDRSHHITRGGMDVEYTKLGRTGLDVSRICLGCMSYGTPDRGGHPWTLEEDAARPLIRAAVEAGVTFFDTANVYSDGTSEEIVGRALAEYAPREEIVLATKVHGRMRPGLTGRVCRGRPSSPRSTRACAASGRTMWTSTSSTAGTRTPRSRRRWRPCTTW